MSAVETDKEIPMDKIVELGRVSEETQGQLYDYTEGGYPPCLDSCS